MLQNNEIPYMGVCTNDTKVVTDPKKIYGYYQRTIQVEIPVANVTVSNNAWLKHGDLVRLKIKFTGTSPVDYCTVVQANDNSTDVISTVRDDDDCMWRKIYVKEIDFTRFLAKSSNSYTITVFIKNEVSSSRTPIGVKFYEGSLTRSYQSFHTFHTFFDFRSTSVATFSLHRSCRVFADGNCFDYFRRGLLRSKSKPISGRSCRF